MQASAANVINCQICEKQQFKYTCPKCNIIYCSVNCYKAPAHLKCSEEFYKNCIQDELAATNKTQADMSKIYDILKRMRESDAGIEPQNFDDGLDEVDSDDEAAAEEEDADDAEEDEEDDIAARLQGINLNNAEEVWQCLTATERLDFQKMLDDGNIMKLVPDYKPWWLSRQHNSKIVELPAKDEANSKTNMPTIATNIAKFNDICKKQPASCLHYNLWNILSAYACTARYYSGEHCLNAGEAVAHLVNLSAHFKYGTNFEDAEDAIISVEMEALSSGNGSTVAGVAPMFIESREQLQKDARQLMCCQTFKLAALSDLLELLKLAKQQLKMGKKQHMEFQKLFALQTGSVEVNRAKVQQILKKIEFLLAYVNREENE